VFSTVQFPLEATVNGMQTAPTGMVKPTDAYNALDISDTQYQKQQPANPKEQSL